MQKFAIAIILLACAMQTQAGGEDRSIPVDINCNPLMPAREASSEMEIRANAEVKALFQRIPLLRGSGDSAARITREDLLKGVPNADRVIEAQLRAYLICQAIRQRPDKSLELVHLFVGQILPAIGQGRQADAVLNAKSFPKSGVVNLDSGTTVFDGGTLVIETRLLSEVEARQYLKLKPDEKAASVGPLVELTITHKPYGPGVTSTSTSVFRLKERRKYIVDKRRFSLAFVEYFDGSGTVVVEVGQMRGHRLRPFANRINCWRQETGPCLLCTSLRSTQSQLGTRPSRFRSSSTGPKSRRRSPPKRFKITSAQVHGSRPT